jgi:hypothetical protein
MKCVYNIQTGQILSFVQDSTNMDDFLSNWDNAGYVNNLQPFPRNEIGCWRIDLDSLQLVRQEAPQVTTTEV